MFMWISWPQLSPIAMAHYSFSWRAFVIVQQHNTMTSGIVVLDHSAREECIVGLGLVPHCPAFIEERTIINILGDNPWCFNFHRSTDVLELTIQVEITHHQS